MNKDHRNHTQSGKFSLHLSLLATLLLALSGGCTNYSSETQTVNPPILFEITTEGTHHLVKVAAQNKEIGFLGYRLYQGTSEEEVLNADPLSGVDCSTPLQTLPLRGVAYYIEVNPDQYGTSNTTASDRLCNVQLSLTSGTWISIRSLIYKDYFSVDTSIPSNALPVP